MRRPAEYYLYPVRCGADNSAESNFCSQCGARVGRQMNTLDSHSSDRSMRIPNPKTAVTCEMKQVTVLFCDIVNSTTHAENLGPEAMHDLINEFLEASISEVHRYGGVAPQSTGDGFMALFGAPLAHEDCIASSRSGRCAKRSCQGNGHESRATQDRRRLCDSTELLNQAHAIFKALGTRGEPVRVKAALVALDQAGINRVSAA